MTFLEILFCLLINYLIGVVVCSNIDNEKQDLLTWAGTMPIFGKAGGTILVASAWPIFLWFWMRGGRVE